MSADNEKRKDGFWWVRRLPRSEQSRRTLCVRPWAQALVRGGLVSILHDDGVHTPTSAVDEATVEWGPYLGKEPVTGRIQAVRDMQALGLPMPAAVAAVAEDE